jgi:hypothetical protein
VQEHYEHVRASAMSVYCFKPIARYQLEQADLKNRLRELEMQLAQAYSVGAELESQVFRIIVSHQPTAFSRSILSKLPVSGKRRMTIHF